MLTSADASATNARKHAERAVFVASAKTNSMDFVPNRNGVLLEPHVVVARVKAIMQVGRRRNGNG
jgi:hypothetical protein